MRRRRRRRRRCRASSSVGVGGEQVGCGGDAVLWTGGGAQETKEQGRKTMVGGKKIRLPPPPYLYDCQDRVVGIVGVFHYHDRFCHKLPRGGMEWGGGSCNRAMTQ
jgi:hypothetical protein